jgi:hypothetical protein
MRIKTFLVMFSGIAACAGSQDPAPKIANRGEDPVTAWQRVHPSDDLHAPAQSERNPTKTIAKHAGSNPCRDADEEAEGLWTRAVVCKSDTECNHYPSTCSAVGNNSAADELVDLDNWRNKNCDREENAFCGATTPYCDKGRCAVRKVPTKYDKK